MASITNVKFGEQSSLTEFESQHGSMSLRENEGFIFCNFGGEKAFVGKSIKDAIANGEQLHRSNLGIVMMHYCEVSDEGVVSAEKSAPMLFKQAGREISIL